jgi:hypothetical protein
MVPSSFVMLFGLIKKNLDGHRVCIYYRFLAAVESLPNTESVRKSRIVVFNELSKRVIFEK